MATGEKNLDKIKRIIANQDHIRNICTSAHIHHGKCIAGNSRIPMADGSMKTAEEIFEEISKSGNIFQHNEEHIIFSPSEKKEIFSLNKKTGKIEKKEIQHAWKLVGGKTIKIKLRNGFGIETTPEHKYIISKDGSFAEIPASDLKLGDRVVCPRKLETKSGEFNIKKEIMTRLSDKNFYVNLEEDFHKELKRKILKFGIKNLKNIIGMQIKEKSFYHGVWQNRYPLSELIKICGILGINSEELYDNVDFIFYRTGKQSGQNSLKIKLPVNFKEFFYLAGLFLGDGSGKKFIVGKEQLGKRMSELCQNIGINAKFVKWKGKTPEIHTNMTLAYILNALFDYPLKKKSHNIKISNFCAKSEDKHISFLLRGYFDTDGCVEKSRRAVTISSASRKMIEDLQLLLLRFGCIAIKEKDNSLSISGLSALNFQKEIGFELEEKAEKLNILIKNVAGGIVCDSIKIGNKVMLMNHYLKNCKEELAFIEIKSIESGFQDIVYDFTIPENHNFISEGMVIHNTAFTDNLLAAAGKLSAKSAGDLEAGMATWQHSDEQERLLTVDAANVSMVHEFNGEEYLINLIDTPGHVDFSGNVTRAMRAIDGTIVLVCASEGIMPQTETVLKQALRERVKPVLFINKVDRLIKELKVTPQQMQERFKKIIDEFNMLIANIAETEFKEKWQVNVADGSVVFGSARDNWALSVPFMIKKKISFADIYKIYDEKLSEEERKDWVWKNASLYEAILDVAIKHLPTPLEAQKYRVPRIWKGDLESEFGKNLMNCNPKGDVAFCITRITIDPRAGKEICAGRLFSGVLKPGMEVYLNLAKKKQRIQQVLVYDGVKPEQVDEVGAGNVLAIAGITGEAGETITLKEETPFEEMRHIFQPVITKAIEVQKSMDLPKLIEVLRKVAKEDPSIRVEINEETGENLISGMGELHLEIIENRIKTEKGVEVKTSNPIVVYRESVQKKSPPTEGRTPNKHNSFFLTVEPLEDNVAAAIERGEVSEGRVKKKDDKLWETLRNIGVPTEETRQYRDVFQGNVFLDKTKGEVYIGEVIELILDAYEMVMKAGPLAREPCQKLKVALVDMKLHEDAIHRGPAQVYPAIRESIQEAFKSATPILLEPVQEHLIEVPTEFMGEITKLVSSKRGQLIDARQEGIVSFIKAKLPVAEMLGWSSDLRSATGGKGISSLMEQEFKKVPNEIQNELIRNIRGRKGLAENQ